jgi:inner membrane organizing system protein 1
VGVIASVILFRRSFYSYFSLHFINGLFVFSGRAWPVAFSTGFGAGAAYADCDRSFNPTRIPGTRIVPNAEIEKQ